MLTTADIDYFALTVAAAGVLSLRFDRPDDAIASGLLLSLEDAGGATVAAYPDAFDPQDVAIALAQPGTYFVRIGTKNWNSPAGR